MKRKRIVKIDTRPELNVAEALATCAQTILIISILQRQTDPNEAYNEWLSNIDSLRTSAEVIQVVLDQYAEEIKNLKVELPPHIVLGGYRVEDIDKLVKEDDLPF